jgi:hypothetical protein
VKRFRRIGDFEMVNEHPLTCDAVAGEDLVERYADGQLTAAEAERFEAHYFACDRCWGDLRTVLALRSAAPSAPHRSGSPSPRPAGPSRLGWHGAPRRWIVPTAAAAAIVLAVGLSVLTRGERRENMGSIVRGAESGLSLTIQRAGDSVLLSWPNVEGSVRARVRVYTEDGRLVRTRESPGARVTLDGALVDTLEAVFVQVDLFDRIGTLVATSPLQRVPGPEDEGGTR